MVLSSHEVGFCLPLHRFMLWQMVAGKHAASAQSFSDFRKQSFVAILRKSVSLHKNSKTRGKPKVSCNCGLAGVFSLSLNEGNNKVK